MKTQPSPGRVADLELTLHRLRGLQTDREPEADPGAIAAPLGERTQQVLYLSRWEPAAFVLDVDERALCGGPCTERHGGPRARELERVLDQIGNRRREDLSIGRYDQGGIGGRHVEPEPSLPRHHRGPDFDFLEDLTNRHPLDVLDARVEPDVRKRPIDEPRQPHQASRVDGAGTSTWRDGAFLNASESEYRGVDDVSHFMGEEPESLGSRLGDGSLAETRVLGHRPRDCIIEAKIERSEFIRRERGVTIDGQARDHLAKVAVVVDDLRHGHSVREELTPVLARAFGDLPMIARLV